MRAEHLDAARGIGVGLKDVFSEVGVLPKKGVVWNGEKFNVSAIGCSIFR